MCVVKMDKGKTFYTEDMFKKAEALKALPKKPPRTDASLKRHLAKLKRVGFECPELVLKRLYKAQGDRENVILAIIKDTKVGGKSSRTAPRRGMR